MPIDRTQGWHVSSIMSSRLRLSAILALAMATAAGCGGKDKKTPATPGSVAGPNASGDVPTTTMDDSGAYGSTKPDAPAPAETLPPEGDSGSDTGEPAASGDSGAAPESGGAPAAAAPIKPPGLDLSQAQKRAKIQGNLDKARAALTKKNPDAETGIAEARAALAVDEKNLAAMLFLAHGNYLKKYYDKAEYVLVQAEKTPAGQQNAGLYFLFGLVYEATDREDKAESSYKKAVSLNRNYRSAVLNLGVYHLKNKRYRQAVDLYERLTGPLGAKSASAWTNLGSGYRGLTGRAGISSGERKQLLLKAESAFKRATTFDKSYANAYYNLGLLYLDADPYPSGSGEMDTLKRLSRAKTYFEEYSRMPGADTKQAKEQMAVAQKLHDREKRIREKRRKREERRRKRNKDG